MIRTILSFLFVLIINCVFATSAKATEASFSYEIDGSEVTFTNTSTDADQILWVLAPGVLSAEASPTYDFEEAGVYSVCLYASNNTTGAFDYHCETIEIVCTVNASFSYETDGLSLTLTSTSSGASAFMWSIVGLPLTYGESITIDLPTSGTYTICLTAFDTSTGCQANYCESIIALSSFFTDPPIAEFSYSISPSGYTTFTNESDNSDNYLWVFDDSDFNSLENPTYTFSPGIHNVCLFAFNSFTGEYDNHCEEITVNCPENLAGYSYNVDGLSVQFTSTPSAANSFVWNITGEDPIYGENPLITFEGTGSYNVCLEATQTSTGCSDSYCESITLVEPCIADFNFSVSGLNVDFTNASTAYNTSSWFIEGTAYSTTDPSHTFTAPGVYEVCLTVENTFFDCTNTNCKDINIGGGPTEAQGIDIYKVLVNECGGPAGRQEAVFFRLNETAVDINTMDVSWPQNNWKGLCDADSKIAEINAGNSGSGQLLPPPADGILPYDANVVLFSSTTINLSAYDIGSISEDTYALFQCAGPLSGGHLPNSGTGEHILKISFDGAEGTVNYNTAQLSGEGDGDYLLYLIGEYPEAKNEGCVLFTADTPIGVCGLEALFYADFAAAGTITLVNASTVSSPMNYIYDLGNGDQLSVPNSAYTYAVSGTYEICLTITSLIDDCTDTYCTSVVIDIPSCEITSDFSHTVDGYVANFTNLSSGDYTDLYWNFGDGNISYEENPSHNFTAPSTEEGYFVCLSAYNVDNGCVDIQCRSVVIPPSSGGKDDGIGLGGSSSGKRDEMGSDNEAAIQQELDWSQNPLQVRFDYQTDELNASFKNTSSGKYKRVLWEFGDGRYSHELHPTHTYNKAGSYTFKLYLFTDDPNQPVLLEESTIYIFD